jgi:para-aminobenzoate synthetase
VRVVLIDNHDSYTFNLAAQLVVAGAQVRVLSNDDDALQDLHPSDLDGLVISPGPGSPLLASDVGHCVEVLERLPDTPVLGICLGHQLLAHLAGGRIVPVRPRHGHVADITHQGAGILAGLPSPFVATRYHSLAVVPGTSASFDVTARAEDDTVMAIEDRLRPWWGVQFHPESVATTEGARIVDGWLDEVRRRSRQRMQRRHVIGPFDPAVVFTQLYAASPWAFWIDSNDPTTPGTSWLGDAAEIVTGDESGCTIRSRAQSRDDPDNLWAFLDRIARSGGATALPGGYVGYLAYPGSTPAGRWLRAERVIAHDATSGDIELQALPGTGAEDWLRRTATALEPLRGQIHHPPLYDPAFAASTPEAGRTRAEYLDDIATCQDHLTRGESYEICLTDRLTLPPVSDPLQLYLAMRAESPTSRSVYLRIDGLVICSTTPEEFVSVSADGQVRSRPIKGTAPRSIDLVEDASHAAALATDAKTRAENLMIVDLVRHDLNRVCEPGSVAVPGLLEVETYTTVHQLVSTVTGRLRAGVSAIDAVRSCFPPGSMTGAPKERTMKIINALEPAPRGIYAGAVGWVGADGSADLSVVIRTAVCTPENVTIGVGGAITVASDPLAEYEETQLKAKALLQAYAAVSSRE